MAIRVLITGDRNWHCDALARGLVSRMAARYGADLLIVHGAARGVDAAFGRACTALRVAQEVHPADWNRLGLGAGPVRNRAMVDLGADFAVAVHRGLAASKGTRGCVRMCLVAGIPVWLIDNDDGKSRKLEEL